MSELPNNWASVKLSDLGTWRGGGTPSKSNPSFWTDGTIPWVSPKDMKKPKLSSAQDFITESAVKNSSANLLDEGSLLIVTRSGIPAHSLPIAVNLVSVSVNQDIKAITPCPATDSEFLWYAFKVFECEILNTCRKGGTTVHSIEFPSLQAFEIPLPPLNEQKRIVAKNEELFSELDAGEASLRQAKQQLGVYRQSLLKQAFEGKLTQTWRQQNPDKLESPDHLLARIRETDPTTVEPHECDNWRTIQFGELTEYITSGSRGWAAYYSESGSTFIRAQNLKKDYLDLSDIAYVTLPEKAEGKRTLTQTGDILITITGANVTKTGYIDRDIGEAYVSQHVALCRTLDPRLTKFLYLYIISPSGGRKDLEKAAYGAGKPGLNLTNLRELRVPICSLAEQREIVRLLDAQFEVIAQNEGEIDAALRRSEALRQSILKKAFSGQLAPKPPPTNPPPNS
ncbi:restriction endonuclease subunit S [Pelagicoccus sp. SDUM812002]|uniref:restriction endonuclease subunit S n=1 Tax=Pelagicoccus sp. SDUM812002 TaxID=3041266 RepID=UPI0028100A11|nr:restriction endonuclease subunit S [Pelagicoccus sp. SDUM812002]MDQ8186686.1 restriction endonuclease subunit S [Pelagicoccus sp. SDUM812002]